ncbi:hypothetical protein RRG08_025759 [Elysia crispata]|uniref:Uncharacterized protein n=1 Tax=Elysia crispata TaxID=231223 RepID=A0AAE1AIR4_9GAST|nr:hypothetical protein RRG08_025759 [Elysia crispata]
MLVMRRAGVQLSGGCVSKVNNNGYIDRALRESEAATDSWQSESVNAGVGDEGYLYVYLYVPFYTIVPSLRCLGASISIDFRFSSKELPELSAQILCFISGRPLYLEDCD